MTRPAPIVVSSVETQLTALVRELPRGTSGRVIVGISGSPGSGKSTLARALVRAIGPGAVYLPMDGFHLADEQLSREGLLERKGAPDTFDAFGYARLLETVRARPRHTIYAPDFDRRLEQPLAGARAIEPRDDIIVTEGNYLMLPGEAWSAVRRQLDTAWHVVTDPAVRQRRLLARHETFGKTPDAARQWVRSVDEPNARLIEAREGAADRILDLTEWVPDPESD
ncbi:nucleoside/nucleotide kinase family protein [Agreia sp. VKM Ac-1783]|uniref:nucleoside/nucleotide kinase family protein n=1 Tax=Agreia sp. VKM Ac-1783 TaxID=1938889 RepID=UPI0020165F29|nr:nucleoside/nucleotide kinase family protein [Agreia sp. VKM Ac-1783]